MPWAKVDGMAPSLLGGPGTPSFSKDQTGGEYDFHEYFREFSPTPYASPQGIAGHSENPDGQVSPEPQRAFLHVVSVRTY